MAATQKKKQQEAPAPQVEARIDRMVDGDYKTKAYASVTIAGAFAVHGLRVIGRPMVRALSVQLPAQVEPAAIHPMNPH